MGAVIVRRWLAVAVGVTIIGLGGLLGFLHSKDAADEPQTFSIPIEQIVAESYSEHPTNGLAYDWVDCLEHFVPRADAGEDRILCRDWSAQGVTSTLLALRTGADFVPVIESRLDGVKDTGIVVVDVVGGTGDTPYAIAEGMTREKIKELHDKFGDPRTTKSDGARFIMRLVEETSAYQVLKRGFTIASIAYWGTSVRTLYEPGEFAAAADDVRAVVDHYRDIRGAEPPMITTSFGNQVALAALGEERLETMHVLSNVPLMTGLQAHLTRVDGEIEKIRAAGEDPRGFARFNVYKRAEHGFVFDYTKMLDHYDHITRFLGDADFPYSDVEPQSPCSRIVLGSEDPRTKDYLKHTPQWPPFVTVVEADHDVERDAPGVMRSILADFSDCVLRETST
jgi:hypothetical protein